MGSERIYHHTAMNSCCSIFNTKSLWMSDCRFLNDSYEMHGAIDKMLNMYDESEKKKLETAFFSHNLSRHYCVCCFSKSPKILSQWRAYSNDGTGVAIGFAREILDIIIAKSVDCIYENHAEYIDGIREKHRDEIRLVLEKHDEFKGINEFWAWLDVNHSILDTIITDLLRVKNEAFSEEQEVRIVKSYSRGDVEFRMRDDVIVPYKAVSLLRYDEGDFRVVLPEVWLGPKCSELNQVAMWSRITFPQQIKHFNCGYR